jgi:hypothetical protein
MLRVGRRGLLYRTFEQTPFPPTDSDSPARASHVELAWHDPEGARRQRLKVRV